MRCSAPTVGPGTSTVNKAGAFSADSAAGRGASRDLRAHHCLSQPLLGIGHEAFNVRLRAAALSGAGQAVEKSTNEPATSFRDVRDGCGPRGGATRRRQGAGRSRSGIRERDVAAGAERDVHPRSRHGEGALSARHRVWNHLPGREATHTMARMLARSGWRGTRSM
jgi:hypothetical protein